MKFITEKIRVSKIKVLGLSLGLLSLSFSEAQILTLDSIISRIEKNNPELQKYNLTIQAYDTYAKGAKSWMPPQAGAGFWMTPYRFEKNMGMFMTGVEQMIPNPKKQNLKEDYLSRTSSVVKENLRSNRNELFAEAKQNYFEAIVLLKKQLVLKQSEGRINFLIDVSQARYTYQKEILENIYKAQANLYRLQNEQVMLDNELKQKKIALNTLMNRDEELEFTIDTILQVPSFSLSIPDSASVDTIRSDIRALNQTIKLMQLNQKLEQSNRLPEFGVRFDHMQGFGEMTNQFNLMGMITIPIVPWSSREYKANVEGMNLEIQAMKKEKEGMMNGISGMLQKIKSEVDNKKKQFDFFKNKILPSLEKGYVASRIAYEQNTGDLFRVLDAWETLQMSEMQYLDLLKELLMLQVEYEKETETFIK